MPTWSTTTASDLFKINYLKLSENVYNSATPTLGRVKKNYTFTGSQRNVAVPLSFQGGVGAGSLPTANVADYDSAVITSNKVYSVVLIDRESIKASSNDAGAFVRGLKEVVRKGVESYMRLSSQFLYGNGDGSIGTVASVTGSDPYVLTFTSGTYTEGWFEENDYVNIEAANTDPFEITTVAPQTDGTLDVTVDRISGSQAPASTDEVFFQNSEDSAPQGLDNVTDATSSTLYSVTVARRWQSTQVDASSGGLTVDLMNETMLEVERKTGKAPDIVTCSYTQFRKLLNLLEDHKEYQIPPRYGSDTFRGQVSFTGVRFMSSRGAIPVFPERMCPDDRMYFLNTNHIECHHRPDFGWFSDDGTVFLREASSDEYSARYGGYYENYIVPTFQGRIDALAT